MPDSNLLVRSLHDLGAAAWFGGALMGAVGVNGASQDVSDPTERARVASTGWARWAPVNAVAIGGHLVGGAGLVLANRGRVQHQQGTGANTAVKTLLTAAAMATTAYSGVLGAQVLKETPAPAEGGTKPSAGTPDGLAAKQQQLRVLQWVTPVLTGAIVVLAAQQGEQQKPAQQVTGLLSRTARQIAS